MNVPVIKGIRCYINCCLKGTKVDESIEKEPDEEGSSS